MEAATATPGNLNRLAASATTHCLTGCVIGEVLGMFIGTAFGWGNLATIALAVGLAYLFGFGLTSLPLFRAGLTLAAGFAIAYPFAFLANRYMIARGKGHAVVHDYH
jgi:hypothetical protein